MRSDCPAAACIHHSILGHESGEYEAFAENSRPVTVREGEVGSQALLVHLLRQEFLPLPALLRDL